MNYKTVEHSVMRVKERNFDEDLIQFIIKYGDEVQQLPNGRFSVSFKKPDVNGIFRATDLANRKIVFKKFSLWEGGTSLVFHHDSEDDVSTLITAIRDVKGHDDLGHHHQQRKIGASDFLSDALVTDRPIYFYGKNKAMGASKQRRCVSKQQLLLLLKWSDK